MLPLLVLSSNNSPLKLLKPVLLKPLDISLSTSKAVWWVLKVSRTNMNCLILADKSNALAGYNAPNQYQNAPAGYGNYQAGAYSRQTAPAPQYAAYGQPQQQYYGQQPAYGNGYQQQGHNTYAGNGYQQ